MNEELLVAFLHGFFGYGRLEARVWLVGMEEGGGNDINEVAERIRAWEHLGRPLVADVARFHQIFGQGRWFDERARTQPTWRNLIRLLQTAQRQDTDIEQVRQYQIERLARADADEAILELLPLPNPSMDRWTYGRWAHLLPFLHSRPHYADAVLGYRANLLQI